MDRGTCHLGRELERREDKAGQRDRPIRKGAREDGDEGWTEGHVT